MAGTEDDAESSRMALGADVEAKAGAEELAAVTEVEARADDPVVNVEDEADTVVLADNEEACTEELDANANH
jgi:hypothetical protein